MSEGFTAPVRAGTAPADAGLSADSAWEGGRWRLTLSGRLDRRALEASGRMLDGLKPDRPAREVLVDLSGVTALDTAGALRLQDLEAQLSPSTPDRQVRFEGLPPGPQALLEAVRSAGEQEPEKADKQPERLNALARIGKRTVGMGGAVVDGLAFLGLVTVRLVATVLNPKRLRLTATVAQMDATGLRAMPIVGLLSFLIGVVLTYQGAEQLRQFGAEVMTVNLIAISILREIGVLITAIIVAGRSGSAFTAQIGTMKVSQEIDAMETLAFDPIDFLVLPRLLAMLTTLPLLVFYANLVGLLGGAVMCWVLLDIPFYRFVDQLRGAIDVTTIVVGLVKAPVFAAVIALVGCYQGLKVTGSAESVGTLTTKSVVQAIFLVIVMDALFSILFSILGV